jgi:FkbM family methyltransferase
MVPTWISGQAALNSLADHPLFRALPPAQTLGAAPMGFVDVGARGGVHGLVLPIAALTAVLGFEPDVQACEELARKAQASPWSQFRVLPVALSHHGGPAMLYLCRAPTNHSLLPTNKPFIERYDMKLFAPAGEIALQTRTLDDVLFGDLAGNAHWGEFIKLDTQGSEYEILQGARRMLRERTVAAFIETEFCEVYKKQKLFSEIELMLRESGLVFYGFYNLNERSRKLLDKRRFVGRERLLYADAVFFKDPLANESSATLDRRGEHALFVCALLLGYFDFALELALATFATDIATQDTVRKLVEDLAYVDPGAARHAAVNLLEKIHARPELANVAIGQFVDDRRAVSNFDDIAVRVDGSGS